MQVMKITLIGLSLLLVSSCFASESPTNAHEGTPCDPDYSTTPLVNGAVNCTDVNNDGSKCTFTCNDGFVINGNAIATCNNSKWNAPMPKCEAIAPKTCPSLTEFTNGTVNCTDSNAAGSVCTFSCNDGFKNNGATTLTCSETGEWDHEEPTCDEVTCEPDYSSGNVTNGDVTCTDKNNFNSVCSFSCKDGYNVTGEEKLTCTDKGTWDNSAPTCEEVTCEPDYSSENVTNGDVTCTEKNNFNSVCSFSCKDGYNVTGEEKLTCTDKGTWDNSAPTCEEVTCEPDYSSGNVTNGDVTCTDKNNFNSTCSFSCKDGYNVAGEEKLTCTDKGTWDNSAPTCEEVTCKAINEKVANGNVSCSDKNNFNSTCTYQCDEGFETNNLASITCTDKGDWTSNEAMCYPSEPNKVEPDQYYWNVTDAKNNTCFEGHLALQFRVQYVLADGSTNLVYFDFTNSSKIEADNCTANSVDFTVHDELRGQSLTVFLAKNNKTFAVTGAEVQYEINGKWFPNSQDIGFVAHASAKSLNLLETPLNKTYSCSVETQVEMNSDAPNNAKAYLRLTKVDSLRAFIVNGTTPKDESAPCFSDQKHALSAGSWKVQNATSKKTCAELDSTLEMHIQYKDISGQMITAKVPIDGANSKLLNASSCGNMTTKTNTVIAISYGGMNLTMEFPLNTTKSGNATLNEYYLDFVQLEYYGDNQFLPNHAGGSGKFNITGTSLEFFKTPITSSYKCQSSVPEVIADMDEGVTDGLSIGFSSTQYQAFGMNDGKFSDASSCPADIPSSTTAPVTTATTPAPPHPHVHGDPEVAEYLITDSKDNSSICLHAMWGLQLRTTYVSTDSIKDDISFNFDKSNSTTVEASCTADNATIKLSYMNNVNVTLMFVYDKDLNTSYLGNVAVDYKVTKADFPNEIPDKNANPVHANVSTNLFTLPTNSSYLCMEHETDVLIAEDIVLRIMGNTSNPLQVESMGASANFSKAQHCFADVYYNQTTLNAGNWSIMYPENNNLTCARYMFGATLQVDYKDVLGNTTHTKIFLDNSTSIDHSGTCYNASADTSFVLFNLMLDDSTTNFTFTFNISGDTYDLVDIHVEYDPISKYFPNHENISESTVNIGTGDRNLFSTETDHCYKCDSSTPVKINGTTTITFENMQLQPFGINSTTGVFSEANMCTADQRTRRIVTLVILILIGLTILGGVAFVGYKVVKRNRNKNKYNQLLA